MIIELVLCYIIDCDISFKKNWQSLLPRHCYYFLKMFLFLHLHNCAIFAVNKYKFFFFLRYNLTVFYSFIINSQKKFIFGFFSCQKFRSVLKINHIF